MSLLILQKKAFGILLGALFFSVAAQAQTIDSTNQKPQLNNELPGVPVPTQPAPPTPRPVTPPPPVAAPDTTPAPTQPTILRRTPAADEEAPTLLDRLFIGSTGGLGFGSNMYSGSYFYVSASPFVGYRILPRWAVGPGFTYEYTGTNGYRLSTYGGKLFTQVSVFKGLFAHLEHEILSAADLELQNNQIIQTRRNITSTLAGGGYRQMNGNFGMDMYVLFNLNTGVYQYRSNPVVRVGFIYNLKSAKD